MDLPKFYNGIKFYNYYFVGMDKPIIIEARDKVSARIALNNIVDKLPEKYRQQKPCGETVIVPVRGISTKKVKDNRGQVIDIFIKPTLVRAIFVLSLHIMP